MKTLSARQNGFTLIEIMLVAGILAIVMTMGMPAIYHAVKREGLRKAQSDLMELCSQARTLAILSGGRVELRFLPQDGRFEVGGARAAPSREETSYSIPDQVTPPVTQAPSTGSSRQLPKGVTIEMLDVNFVEYKDADEARVRFFPNGTCDEMTVVLRSDENEYRMITLEITTSRATVESDPQKFK